MWKICHNLHIHITFPVFFIFNLKSFKGVASLYFMGRLTPKNGAPLDIVSNPYFYCFSVFLFSLDINLCVFFLDIKETHNWWRYAIYNLIGFCHYYLKTYLINCYFLTFLE